MIKKLTFFTPVVAIALLVGNSFNSNVFSNGAGAPSGNTNSPASGSKTCNRSGCHDTYNTTFPAPTGTIVVMKAGTTTPVTSWSAGSSYDVLVTSEYNTNFSSGFQASVENSAGAVGSVSAGTNNQVVGTNYVTHTANSSSGPMLSWKFTWTAPTSGGKGTVRVYAAINKSDGSFGRTGDTIKVATYTLTEAVGINEITNNNLVRINQTLVSNVLNANFSFEHAAATTATIFNMNGAAVQTINLGTTSNGNETINVSDLTSGMYILSVKHGNVISNARFVKQ
ncbi:MAG: T9SS type A sorting domain-containing protein [Chitinophagales bacterium]|nr:T9SS type A sorting domain-containing protein [Chitinophagales bacterium]